MSNQQNSQNAKFIATRVPQVGEESYIAYHVNLVKNDEDFFTKTIAEIIPQYDHTKKSRGRFYGAAYERMFKHLGFVEDDKHKTQKHKQYLDFLQQKCHDINEREKNEKRTEMIKKIQKAYTALYGIMGKTKKVTKDYKFLTDFLKENKIYKMSEESRKHQREWYHANKNKAALVTPNAVKQQETIIQANNSEIPFTEQSQESKSMFGAEPRNTFFQNNNIIQNDFFNDKLDKMNYNESSEENLDELSEVGKQNVKFKNNIIQNDIFNDKLDEMNYNESSEENLDELYKVKKQLKFKVLKQQNSQNVEHHAQNNEYHKIDEKVESIVNNKQYEVFFKAPREVFERTLSDAERQYYTQKILPYQMQQLGYKGAISDYYKDNITAYATYLTQLLKPIYDKKQNNQHYITTSKELDRCRKIQKAYTGLLQLSGSASQKDEFKSSFTILDDWMHNHKVPTKKQTENYKQYDMNYNYNVEKKNNYRVKAEKDGFSVNIHTTMDKKKKQQTNILLTANNEKQDNKLLGNKRKIEDCLFNVFDNEDFTKKNNSFYPNFNDNEYENNSIDNNLLFNDNEYEHNSIGNNNNLYNESLFNLNCDKTFKGFGK